MLEHREWVGCTLWDLIQPSFMFMVGVALPFSIASRARGASAFGRMLAHALLRSLRAGRCSASSCARTGSPQTYCTFEDVLTQIGLGYPFLFLLAWAKSALAGDRGGGDPRRLLGGVRALPAAARRTSTRRRSACRRTGRITCRASPRTGTRTPTWPAAFDLWFLNLFPRETPFVFNGGGYSTLNFVPSLATMIFGLLAGELCEARRAGAGEGVACSPRAGVAGIVRRAGCWTSPGSARSSSASGRRPGPSSAPAGLRCSWPAFYAAIDVRGWPRAGRFRWSWSA